MKKLQRKSIIKIVAGLIILALIGFAGYKYWQSKQATTNSISSDNIYTVQRMDLKSIVSGTGTVYPVEAVDVSSKITGRIKTVLVKENDNVKQGQTVATLDSTDLENELKKAQEKVTNTSSKYNRANYLYSIGAESKADFEDAEYNYETAKSDVEVAKYNLDETVITSPMDGIIVGKPQTPGTMAVQGTSNPTVIMRIADLSRKQILAKIDETDIGSINVGQEATFTVDAYTNKNFTAKVTKISQTDTDNSWDTASSSSSTSSSSSSSSSVIYYYVTLDIDDDNGLLKPGMTARVDINTADKPNVLAVPLAALKTDSNGSYVVLIDDAGKTTNQYIQTGIYSDDYVEITDGLSEGDKIALTYTAPKTTSTSSSHGGPPL
ncbi:efflux RND transporter periplasmic adaptor subunit [Pectinatus frisingensis]|uniref:efflux RND transporter periplasmic adaptor subunit n=1 Tax=Pectinatus frisingensis TaxID=865 RepID=UPI0018C4963A|nr:efflux RND transporter periplasmic adaptor subunit [Pectinatus frisingensis]